MHPLQDFGKSNASVEIKEATLRVHRCRISSEVKLAHAHALSRGTAKYPLTRVEIKSFTLHTGVTGESLDNVILGQLPKRMILGLVENQAYNGNLKKNPFNFSHHNLNFLPCILMVFKYQQNRFNQIMQKGIILKLIILYFRGQVFIS